MNDSKLNDLFKDFRNKYPKMDYFTQEEIFQYIRMGFHLGYDSRTHKIKPKPLLRSDGKMYFSINSAALENKTDHKTIKRAIKYSIKCNGYNWSYA